MTHKDVTPEIVAEKYLTGMSVMAIAAELFVSAQTIQGRLTTARRLFPHLPWAERKVRPTQSGVRAYTAMNDGMRGESRLPSGSVIRGRGLRA